MNRTPVLTLYCPLHPPLPPAVHFWVLQQAHSLAGGSRFGRAEQDALKQSLRMRFPELWTLKGSASDLALDYLVLAILAHAVADPEAQQRDEAQKFNSELQAVYQDYQQAVTTLAAMAKQTHDSAMQTIANLKS